MAKEFWPNGADEYTEELKDNDYLGAYETSSVVPGNKQRKIPLLKLRRWLLYFFTGIVASVSALEALTGTKEGQTIRLKGYYDDVPLDDMPTYHVVPDSVKTPDGGGVIARLEGGNFEWIGVEEVHIKHYGCVGDNSTPNGNKINNAISYAKNNGNLAVVIGIGSFRYDETIIFNYQGILKGYGQTKSRLIYDGNQDNAFQPATQLGVYQDFGIYAGSGSHVNGWGTLETTTSNGNSGTTMRNIWVQGFSNGVGFRMVDVWNHDLYNCKAIACDIGWQLGNPTTLSVHNSMSYNHCKANSCTTYGMYVKGVTSTNLINGDFSECGIGIYLETAYGLIIQSCYSEFCDTAALSVDNSQVRAVKVIGGIYSIQEPVYPVFNIGAVQEMSIENVYFSEGDIGIKLGHGSGASEVCLSQNYFYIDVVDAYDIGSNAIMSIATPRGYLGERMGYSDFPEGWSQIIEPGTVAGIPKITTTKTGRLSSTFSVLKDEGSKTFLAATSDYIINFASGLVGFAIISAGSDYAIYNLNSGVTPIIESAGFSGGTYALQYSSIVDSGSYLLYNNSGVAVDFCWQITLSHV